MKKFNQNTFNWIIIVLLVLNLGFSFYLNQQINSSTEITNRKELKLPEKFRSFLDDFIVDFVPKYNQQNIEAIFNLFANEAKLEMNREQVENTLEKLYDLTGDLTTEYAFQNYNVNEDNRGVKYYTFNYKIKSETGVTGLELTFRENEKEELELYGFHITQNY